MSTLPLNLTNQPMVKDQAVEAGSALGASYHRRPLTRIGNDTRDFLRNKCIIVPNGILNIHTAFKRLNHVCFNFHHQSLNFKFMTRLYSIFEEGFTVKYHFCNFSDQDFRFEKCVNHVNIVSVSLHFISSLVVSIFSFFFRQYIILVLFNIDTFCDFIFQSADMVQSCYAAHSIVRSKCFPLVQF